MFNIKNYSKKRKVVFYLISSLILASLVLVGGSYLIKTVNSIKYYGFESILIKYQSKAKLIYFLICFLQPIILPLPEPITIIGGSTVFGAKSGALMGFGGTLLGIAVMFFASKYLGGNLVSRMVDEDKLEKFNKYVEKNETLITLMLFILPILPDEVICMGAGLAKMNGYKFILVAAISKVVTSISLSYSINLIKFDWKLVIIAVIVIAGSLFLKKDKLKSV